MTTKELIRAEIERRIEAIANAPSDNGVMDSINGAKGHELMTLLSFLDALPDESEQPARGYDEAYLNEKIAKASKSWEGVDVDKFMDEIRGREPVTDCGELEEEAEEWAENEAYGKSDAEFEMAYKGFIAGAEGMKRKLMEGAEECELYLDGDFLAIDLNMRELGYSERDKVSIIILPKED